MAPAIGSEIGVAIESGAGFTQDEPTIRYVDKALLDTNGANLSDAFLHKGFRLSCSRNTMNLTNR